MLFLVAAGLVLSDSAFGNRHPSKVAHYRSKDAEEDIDQYDYQREAIKEEAHVTTVQPGQVSSVAKNGHLSVQWENFRFVTPFGRLRIYDFENSSRQVRRDCGFAFEYFNRSCKQ